MPEILQQERSECGIACLAMVSAGRGNNLSLSDVRHMAGRTSRGYSLADLVRLAGRIGLAARPLRLPLREIGRLTLPAVLHWRMNHYVVLVRVRRKRILVHDPAVGRQWISMPEAAASFTGVALEFRLRGARRAHRPGPEPGLLDVIRGIRNLRRYLALLVVIVVAGQLLSLAPAVAMQILIDELIVGQAEHWLNGVLLGLGAALLCGVLADATRSWISLYSGTQLAIDSTSNVVSRLLRMPVDYIRARNLGDLMSRLDSLAPLRRAITDQAANSLGNLAVVTITLVVMLIYDPALAMISVAGFIGSMLVLVSILPAERRLAERVLIERAAEKNSLLETFRAYETVCGLGIGNTRDSHWQNRFFDATASAYRAGKIAILRSTMTGMVTAAEQLTFLAIGVSSAMHQEISIGALFVFMSLRARFSVAAMQLMNDAQQLSLLRVHVRRLAELVSGDAMPVTSRGAVRMSVRGEIDVAGLTFGYSNRDALFGPLDFAIGEGDHVVITGPTGCGKTTLLRLLAGQLEPGAGIVRLDGIELSLWDRDALTGQFGIVMQNEHLFHGTISDNISAFDPEVDLAKVREAALVAGIWSDIQRLPMMTQTLLGDTGLELSGGQVQRLALARALYRQPRILFLDEATSHLDVDTESRILRNIRALNVTTISVAHRPAAMNEASRVIRLGPAPASPPIR